VKRKAGRVHEWAGDCSTEERILRDVPWDSVVAIVQVAAECVTADSVRDNINKVCKAKGLPEIADLTLPAALTLLRLWRGRKERQHTLVQGHRERRAPRRVGW
jgi:energy-coupling factor transporter ATP-binding protein EcfA2